MSPFSPLCQRCQTGRNPLFTLADEIGWTRKIEFRAFEHLRFVASQRPAKTSNITFSFGGHENGTREKFVSRLQDAIKSEGFIYIIEMVDLNSLTNANLSLPNLSFNFHRFRESRNEKNRSPQSHFVRRRKHVFPASLWASFVQVA